MSNKEIVIKVDNVYKAFRIPHEKQTSLKSAALNIFKKKSYTKYEAAKGVSFQVEKGEFLGIIGRNGCGKSTMLKMLAGIYIPDKGKITVNGRLSPFLELGVGFNPELTARDNVYLNGTILGLTRKEINERFDEIIAFAELEEFVDQKLKNFSSGMQVRLAFAVAIQAHAEILLIDEVLAVGDESFQRKCFNKFVDFKKNKKTVVFVSHSMETVRRYCDKCILLHQGIIYSQGDTEQISRDYEKLNLEKTNEKESKILGTTPPKLLEIENVVVNSSVNGLILNTNEPLFIEIKYKIVDKGNVDELNFAIGLHAEEGGYIFAYSTKMDKIKVDKNKGIMTLEIPKLPLLGGFYYLNVNAFSDIEANYYDYRPKAFSFKIVNKKQVYRGILNIKHNWR